jgi:SAM-dependent methyltransferase
MTTLRRAAHALRIPPVRELPYAVPGVAPALRTGWRLSTGRATVMTVDEHAAATGVRDIEEIIGCSLCGERRVRPLFQARPGRDPSKRYHVVLCAGCGFLYRHPGIRPERLGELYSGGRYAKFLTGHYSERRRRRYRLVMDAFGPLFADGEGRRLLDFGSGAGLFLELAHERGFDCYGVDLSPDAVEHAKTRPGGAKSFCGSPDEVPEIAAGGFDVITLWSVLAHLATPVEDFTMLRRLLADDGVLLVLTVNANSLDLKARRARWGGFTPNHLKFYSPETLPRLLERSGFGAAVTRSMEPDYIAAGGSRLTARQVRRVRRTVAAGGDQGNMLRAVAFADPEGPARWGLSDGARVLSGSQVVAPA